MGRVSECEIDPTKCLLCRYLVAEGWSLTLSKLESVRVGRAEGVYQRHSKRTARGAALVDWVEHIAHAEVAIEPWYPSEPLWWLPELRVKVPEWWQDEALGYLRTPAGLARNTTEIHIKRWQKRRPHSKDVYAMIHWMENNLPNSGSI